MSNNDYMKGNNMIKSLLSIALVALSGCYTAAPPSAYPPPDSGDEIIIETIMPATPSQPKQTVTKKTVKKKACPPCPTCDKKQ
jgi:hypothetical protein